MIKILELFNHFFSDTTIDHFHVFAATDKTASSGLDDFDYITAHIATVFLVDLSHFFEINGYFLNIW
jgi:hypothetical protein